MLCSREWRKLAQKALQRGQIGTTTITVVTATRAPGADLMELGITSQNYEVTPLRKWLAKTMMLRTAGTTTETPQGSQHCQVGPLIVYHHESGLAFQRLPPPMILGEQPPPVGFHLLPQGRNELRTHFVFNGPAEVMTGDSRKLGMTASRWLMFLNDVDRGLDNPWR